jgi:hypothetical protein
MVLRHSLLNKCLYKVVFQAPYRDEKRYNLILEVARIFDSMKMIGLFGAR